MEIKVQPSFAKEIKKLAKKYSSMASDFANLLASLQDFPTQGAALGRDCYKIRMSIAAKNKGKSGGARIITCVKITQDTIHLLSIYDKSEKENITTIELDDLLKQLD
jgi:mRNA-degrading endonuclease RelE of RelBE toxin-antitoxin system